MARQYLIISDLHMADVEDHADGWKAYKSSRFLFDDDFRDLLMDFVSRREQEDEKSELVLLLNGDVFDFDLVCAVPDDAPWKVYRSEYRTGLDATEEKSIWKLERILANHGVFVSSLVDFLSAGHRLVYVMGNHDREFHFPGVQKAFLHALHTDAANRNLSFEDSQLLFEPWFFYEPGELYAEHGQQYDHYTSFRNVLDPTVQMHGNKTIALPMGNLSNRTLMPKMGFFNPHASDYILNMFSYAWHWMKYYAFSRRSLAWNWFWGSLLVLFRLLSVRKKQVYWGQAIKIHEGVIEYARLKGLDEHAVIALWQLQNPPITGRLFRIIREFWIDRVVISLLMVGGTVALALVPIPLWIKLVVPLMGFPLVYLFYEWAVQGESIFTIETRLPKVAGAIARILPARVVTFGHTHQPRLLPLGRHCSFVDTGTWAPITKPNDPLNLVAGLRNYLIADFSKERPCVQLGSWMLIKDKQEGGAK